MSLSHYYYLAVVGVLALALCFFMCRQAPTLTSKRSRCLKLEMGYLLAILLLGSLAMYGSFLLENTYFGYLDVGADTIDQYVVFYLGLLDSIREGTFSAWNFNFGLGSSFLGYQSWLFDPFNIILVPAGLLAGNQHLSFILTGIQILKIVACGVLFNRLLAFFCETPLARIAGASVFAFSGFLILWGQHYWLGSVPVVFTALLLCCEVLLKKWTFPRFLALALVSGVCVAWSPYCAAMMLLGTAIFELLRIIGMVKGPKAGRQVLRKVLTLAAPVFCGILLAGIALVPYAQFLFGETGRIGSSESASTSSKALAYATEFVPLRWIPMVLSRLLGSSLISSGVAIPAELVPPTTSFPYVNCYELLALGLSSAILIMLGQFAHWAWKDAGRKQQILIVVATVLVLLYCFNSFLPALFNIFVAPKYRSAFVICVPLCIAFAMGWEKRVQTGKIALAPFVVAALLTLGILAWSFLNSVNGRILCAAVLLCTLAIIGVMAYIVFAEKKQHEEQTSTPAHASWPKSLLVVILALTVATSVADGFFTTNHRRTCTEETFPEAVNPNRGTNAENAIAQLEAEDPGFYRVEKTDGDWTAFNDSLVEGYAGVTAYNSTADGDIIEFFSLVAPDVISDGEAYQLYLRDCDVPVINNILGVRYLLAREPVNGLQSFEYVGVYHEWYVYRNADAGMLTAKTNCMSESDFRALTVEQRRQALESYIVVPDEVAAAAKTSSAANDASSTNAAIVSNSSANTSNASTTYSAAANSPSASDTAADTAANNSSTNVDTSTAATGNLSASVDAPTAATDSGPQSNVLEISSFGKNAANNGIVAAVTADADCYTCLSIPNTAGWTVLVDGQQVETYRSDIGFIGFNVSAGTHTIEAHYEQQGTGLGLILSLAGIASCLAAAGFALTKYRRKS